MAGAKMPLARLSSPELDYILTGNEFSLNINDPAAANMFRVGDD
jgi:hypothetical protein